MAQTMRFRLLAGLHIDNGPKDARGNITDQIYRPGDIIETTENLLKYNAPGFRPKYEAVDAVYTPPRSESYPAQPEKQPPPNWTPPEVTPQGTIVHRSDEELGVKPSKGGDKDYLAALEKMTVKELTAHAAEEEIDLKGAADKNSILRVIRSTLTTK